MNMVNYVEDNERLVSQLPVENLDWLKEAIITRNGKLSNKNFKVGTFLGNINMVRVVNRIGRDYYNELQNARAELAMLYLNISNEELENVNEDSKLRHYEERVRKAEIYLDEIADFVKMYYYREGDYIATDAIDSRSSVIKLFSKLSFLFFLKDFRQRYDNEISKEYNSQADRVGAYEFINGYDAMGYFDEK